MRRFMFVLGAFLALVIVASPADAQIKFGVHGDAIVAGFSDLADTDGDLSGDFGLGARLGFSPPALPIALYADGTYFFPSCDIADCSYWTGGLGAQLGLPLPALRPYILGGWQWKSFSLDGFDSETQNNAFFGAGIQLNVLAGLFVEGQWEFNGDIECTDFSVTPSVLKAGIMFGG